MKDLIYYFMTFVVGIIIGCIISCSDTGVDYMKKGAMEVYKGNTKLQYTVVDSVKVDSCVIFLKK